MTSPVARLMAGVPAHNAALYRQIRFLVGDPVAWVQTPGPEGLRSTLILRDIELDRARAAARADAVACPRDFAPANGLSGDRETATAQAAAELLRRSGVRSVTADRSLPLLFAHVLSEAGIAVQCDPAWGVLERRSKDAQELDWLREAQAATEDAMLLACQLVARAEARRDGVLLHEGAPLTSERVRAAIDVYLLQRGYENPESIVAGGPPGADCHDRGAGELRTGQPVIIDIFPQNRRTQYWGDCTRTVVHGAVPERLAQMHAAVLAAKSSAIAATKASATGEDVHKASLAVIQAQGFSVGLPAKDAPLDYCAMTHGTGHGVGLEVHEPPLLDFKGPPLVAGDVLTIEPGLYCRAIGGVRVEDMVAVTETGCVNFNRLPGDLTWR